MTKSKVSYYSLIKRILSYLKKYTGIILVLIVLNLIANVLTMLGPMYSGKAIDAIGSVSGKVDFPTVFHYCLYLLGFYLAAFVISYLVSRSMIKIGKATAYEMRKQIQEKLLFLPVSYFDTKQTGDIISSISYDVDTLNTSLTNDILQIVSSCIILIFSFVMMIMISPTLVLVYLLNIPASIVIARIRLNVTRPLFHRRSKKLGELNGYTEDILSGLKTIKAYNQENTMNKRFSDKNCETCNAYYEADYQGTTIWPYSGLINNITLGIIGIIGSILYIKGGITIGSLSAFILYSRQFIGPINEITGILGEIQSALSASNRIFTLLDEDIEPEDKKDAHELKNVKGDVSMKDVKFGYSSDKIILNNLNLKAPAGSTIAIVGTTGAGKSTIINLLMRFYDINSGQIMIDNQNILSLTRDSLRKSFAMVLQETWIFSGTIYENISYGSFDASPEKIKSVARAAHIDSFIESLPDGYDTYISDEGSNLSKGQKQLITIARAMLLDSPMLILDEATSNVDSRTELLIQDAMLNLMKGKTCFVIAHRLSTIKDADCILVLSHGDIIEQGSHNELLNQNGYYKELYESQFK